MQTNTGSRAARRVLRNRSWYTDALQCLVNHHGIACDAIRSDSPRHQTLIVHTSIHAPFSSLYISSTPCNTWLQKRQVFTGIIKLKVVMSGCSSSHVSQSSEHLSLSLSLSASRSVNNGFKYTLLILTLYSSVVYLYFYLTI